MPTHTGDLQLADDPRYARRHWLIQRIGRILMLALVLLALSGLFGGGPFSDAELHGGHLTVRYERFARFNAPTRIQISLAAPAGRPPRLTISGTLLHGARDLEVTPTPLRVEIAGVEQTFIFASAADRQSTQPAPAADLQVRLDYSPDRLGPLRAAIRAADQPPLELVQFVFP